MQKDRPQFLQIQTSKAVITNIRSRTTGSRADLATCLNELQQGELFFNSGFPTKEGDKPAVVDKLLQHVNGNFSRHFKLKWIATIVKKKWLHPS
jgi:hypothetical protein